MLVQQVKSTAAVESEEIRIRDTMGAMNRLWELHMQNGDGDEVIMLSGIEQLLLIEEARHIMAHIDVDPTDFESLSKFILQQHGGKLQKKQFKRMLLGFRASAA